MARMVREGAQQREMAMERLRPLEGVCAGNRSKMNSDRATARRNRRQARRQAAGAQRTVREARENVRRHPDDPAFAAAAAAAEHRLETAQQIAAAAGELLERLHAFAVQLDETHTCCNQMLRSVQAGQELPRCLYDKLGALSASVEGFLAWMRSSSGVQM